MALHVLVENVVGAYLEALDAQAAGLVEGLYLVGSVALGDFRPHTSDIDFLAVTASRPDAAALTALERVHTRLRKCGGPSSTATGAGCWIAPPGCPAGGGWPRSPPYATVWVVTGVSRLHYTLATGEITSKEGAGDYALASFPQRWHRVAREALRIRRADRAGPGVASAVTAQVRESLRLRAGDGGVPCMQRRWPAGVRCSPSATW